VQRYYGTECGICKRSKMTLVLPVGGDAGMFVALAVTVFATGAMVVAILGAQHPQEALRFWARTAVEMLEFAYGPDWERLLRRAGDRRMEWLHTALADPHSLASTVAYLRTVYVAVAAVAALLLAGALLILVQAGGAG
jgi:hypothetical protein